MVSVMETSHEMWQVWIEKANESEPPMTCRNALDDIKTGDWWWIRDESEGCPAYCSGGVRHIGGASSVQASARNG